MKKVFLVLTALTMMSSEGLHAQRSYPQSAELELSVDLNGAEERALFGAEVGKGGPGDQDQFDDLQGLGGGDFSDINGACQGVASELGEHEFWAARGGHPNEQRRILKEGLRNALALMNRSPWSYEPLTKQALHRALTIDSLISDACKTMRDSASMASCLLMEADVARYALSRLYRWIVDYVIPLETNYYAPYRRDYYPRCREFDCLPQHFRDPFVTAWSESAATLLSFYLGKAPYGSRLPGAFGKDLYEIRIAEYVTLWAAQDLNQDLSRRSYACIIGDLGRTSLRLKRFNAGGRDGFLRSTGDAVIYAETKISSASHWLTTTRYCSRAW